VFCGDLLSTEATPFLLSGSVLGAIDVLENFLRPLGARTVVRPRAGGGPSSSSQAGLPPVIAGLAAEGRAPASRRLS